MKPGTSLVLARNKRAGLSVAVAKMDIAAAMAQIRECMAAPDTPVSTVIFRASGKREEVVSDQRKLSEVLGGPLTVIGAINKLGVQAVARRDSKGKPNKHQLPETFEDGVKGDVALFRTAEDASPVPFTLKDYDEWVADGMPEDPEEEGEDGEDELELGTDDDDEEEEEEDEDEEDEEDEDEDDDDEEEEEDDEANLAAMSTQDLQRACKIFNLKCTGSKEELVQRLLEHQNDVEEADDDEDEEEEEEEEVVATSKSKAKRGAQAMSSAGPSQSKSDSKKRKK